MLFAKVWTYWIAVPLAAGAIFFGYLNKVVKPKYPPRGQG